MQSIAKSNVYFKSVFAFRFKPQKKLLFSALKSNNSELMLIQAGAVANTDSMAFSGYISSPNSSAFNRFQRQRFYRKEIHELKDAFSETGAVADLPLWYRFGILKVVACFIASVLLGSVISKSFVTFLEENDIFKPEDDDDEED